ncbi:MAG TPA: rhodanese-like domain-containing protein [Planctomycetota bacterium]|nr:rhodanese-like domain-containing protein [Planctomycetota bacterium]
MRIVLLLIILAFAAFGGDQGVNPATVPAAPKKEAPAPKEFPRAEGLVDAATLARWIEKKDTKFIIVDARSSELYAQGHIPGAVNIVSDTLQDTDNPPYFLVARGKLKKLCQESGIDADSRVVIYDEDDGRLAARVWFTLYAYGHDKGSILDGGVAKWRDPWKAGSRQWFTDAPKKAEGTFEPEEKLRGVVGFDDLSQFKLRVQEFGELPTTTLIDARSQAEYMGEEVRGKAGGHIPGAANIEWSALMKGKERERVWRSPPEIHAILRVGGIDKAQKIAVYDQAGGRSSHLFFTLWLMGFENIANYTAGWREYGNKDGAEVEK